jgi:hypothetical protein
MPPVRNIIGRPRRKRRDNEPPTLNEDDGYCRCAVPLRDSAAGAITRSTDEDDDVCWRCRRPIGDDR